MCAPQTFINNFYPPVLNLKSACNVFCDSQHFALSACFSSLDIFLNRFIQYTVGRISKESNATGFAVIDK